PMRALIVRRPGSRESAPTLDRADVCTAAPLPLGTLYAIQGGTTRGAARQFPGSPKAGFFPSSGRAVQALESLLQNLFALFVQLRQRQPSGTGIEARQIEGTLHRDRIRRHEQRAEQGEQLQVDAERG